MHHRDLAVATKRGPWRSNAEGENGHGAVEIEGRELGPAKIEGTDTVMVRPSRRIFGGHQDEQQFHRCDEVGERSRRHGQIFVKSGADYVRLAPT